MESGTSINESKCYEMEEEIWVLRRLLSWEWSLFPWADVSYILCSAIRKTNNKRGMNIYEEQAIGSETPVRLALFT